MLAEFPDRGGDFLVLMVTGQIDVEIVFPVLPLRRAGLDLGKVDAELVEGLQRFDQ